MHRIQSSVFPFFFLAVLATAAPVWITSQGRWFSSQPPPQTSALPWIGGAWSDDRQPASVKQDENDRSRLVFINRLGWQGPGTFVNATTVVANSWEGGLRGTLQDNGNTIRWANGTVSYRPGTSGAPGQAPTTPQTPPSTRDGSAISGVWMLHSSGAPVPMTLVQNGNQVTGTIGEFVASGGGGVYPETKVHGTFDGRVLEFERDTAGSGGQPYQRFRGMFIMGAGGREMAGTFNQYRNGQQEGSWFAIRR